MAEHGWLGPIEWAATSRPRPGEKACGDRLLAIDVSPGAALFGVLDGLGHGAEAARAAQRGVDVLRQDPDKPLGVLIQLCHRALADTRGVAMTLVRIEFEADLAELDRDRQRRRRPCRQVAKRRRDPVIGAPRRWHRGLPNTRDSAHADGFDAPR